MAGMLAACAPPQSAAPGATATSSAAPPAAAPVAAGSLRDDTRHAADPPTFDGLPPEVEEAAGRARSQLARLARHFEHGIPAGEHLLVKVLLPINQSGDVAECLWMEATSFQSSSVEFVVPRHIGSYVPYVAGREFHAPLAQIQDYIHVRADGTRVGGETDRFPQSRPRVRLVQKTSADRQQACDSGKLRDCVQLGALYVHGVGVTKDPAKAAPLFQKACDGGDPEGCLQLGALYALGDGVVKDAAKAKALIQKACDGGELEACELARSLP